MNIPTMRRNGRHDSIQFRYHAPGPTSQLLAGEPTATARHAMDWWVDRSCATPVLIEDWLCRVSATPDEVRRLCSTPPLLGWVQTAVEMARSAFPPASKVSLAVEKDPESDAEWILVEVEVTAAPALAVDGFCRFTQEWVQIAPAATRDRIHLTFHLP